MSALATNMTSMRSLMGGLPNAHQDTFPSILFLVLFTATCGLGFWCLATRYWWPTCLLLAFVRVQLFETVRIVTFGLRLAGIPNLHDVMKGKGEFDETLLIVEQVLLSVGYAMPASMLVQLAGFHASRGRKGGQAAHVVTLAMEFTLMGAIALSIVVGTKVSKAQTDASTVDSMKTMRTVASVIVLVVLGLLIIFCARVSHVRDATLAWLAGMSLLLMIVPIFQLVMTAHLPADSDSTGMKAAFYILQITIEWLVGTSLLAVDAKEWCGIEEAEYTSTYQDAEEAQKLAYTSGSY